ncbi:MAG: DUF5320 domain-containing protein [Deltaproteobacteria bacterium]|nr:DUF5320 domain-containing protein [Deltaproteobacteria bacterium]
MPFGDGTGPAGMGPMTGRAAGYCVPGYTNMIPLRSYFPRYGISDYTGFISAPGYWGRGFGGRGRGWCNRVYTPGRMGWHRFGNRLSLYGW